MDHQPGQGIRPRRSSSRTGANSFSVYRRDSNLSTSSFLENVEMAHDEVCFVCM
jgi:cation-transporting ATPase 13A2